MPRVSDARERLLDSALKLVFRSSYGGVGVGAICGDAGVQKGSFYHFFGSKRELVTEALERFFEVEIEPMLEACLAGSDRPEDKVRRYFEAIFAFQASEKRSSGSVPGCHFGNLAVELGTVDPIVRKAVTSLLERVTKRLEKALAQGEEGLTKAQARRAAAQIVAYMEGILVVAKMNNDPARVRSLAGGADALVVAARGT
tara:strand:+ start:751 stop:1350 length:600 start_codon:yes stop_codon:yes gene_type:complete